MVQRRYLASAIVASLTDDLLKPKYRKVTGRNKYFGHCYVATEAYYHLAGGASSGYIPQRITHEGGTHWYLKHRETGKIVDLTAAQFNTAVPYENGVGCGFLTRSPSKRAAVVIERVGVRLARRKSKTPRSAALPANRRRSRVLQSKLSVRASLSGT